MRKDMTVGEIARTVTWGDVHRFLLRVWPLVSIDQAEGWRRAYDVLRCVTRTSPNQHMRIVLRVQLEIDGYASIEVFGCNGTLKSVIGTSEVREEGAEEEFSLAYREWEDWPELLIDAHTIECIDHTILLAYCILEMTQFGPDADAIRKERRQLMASISFRHDVILHESVQYALKKANMELLPLNRPNRH